MHKDVHISGRAEVLVVKFVQQHAFPHQEIHSIRNEAAVSKSSPISKWSLILQEDMLVVGGRLSYSSIAYAAKHPIILPHKNKVSQMIVEECHNAAHLGTEWMLSQIRNKFWIIKARKLIKKVKYKCVTCKKLYGLPATQKMADYPSERCEPGKPPFTYVGVDLFGPFYVKVGRSEVKRYGCLFTCFNTRAIHIEVLIFWKQTHSLMGFSVLFQEEVIQRKCGLTMALTQLELVQNSLKACASWIMQKSLGLLDAEK